MIRFAISIALIFIFSGSLFGQDKKFPSNKEEKEKFEEAELLMAEGDYENAFEIYKSLNESNSGHAELLFPLGVCAQNMENSNEIAIKYFEAINSADVAESDFSYYYSISLHKAYRFQEAIDQMEKFLKTAKATKEQKKIAKETIEHSKNGIELVANPVNVEITTLGDPLNTDGYEYAPMISADEKTILYTYRGYKSTGGLQTKVGTDKKEYNEDVQIAYKDSAGLWFEPLILQSNINTIGNDACVAITPDAQYLYLFRSIEGDRFIKVN
jgi:tetratricopeptide (TPR) repeat protein